MNPDTLRPMTDEHVKHEGTEVRVLGKKLICPICGGDQFHEREALLNTRGMTFFKLDFMNKSATTVICAACGHILWFLEE